MNANQVSSATTAALVAFYNEHNADKPVKKFADRKTAERRVLALIATLKPAKPAKPAKKPAQPAAAEYVPGTCPNCGATTDITCGTVVDLHGRQHVVNEHHAHCHGCGHEFNYDTGRKLRKAPAKNADRSAAIAASWTNKNVAAARAARHAVIANGQPYRSVREAFMVLALPIGQHIKFRGQLKAAGAAEFSGVKFKLA